MTGHRRTSVPPQSVGYTDKDVESDHPICRCHLAAECPMLLRSLQSFEKGDASFNCSPGSPHHLIQGVGIDRGWDKEFWFVAIHHPDIMPSRSRAYQAKYRKDRDDNVKVAASFQTCTFSACITRRRESGFPASSQEPIMIADVLQPLHHRRNL